MGALRAQAEHDHRGAEPARRVARVAADDAVADDDDLAVRRSEHPREQRAAPAIEFREVVGADERRHRAGDGAHRREQRQAPARVLDGFVGDRGRAACEQRFGELQRRAGEVKVGENDLAA